MHAQQADEAGNVQLWGITGVQKEAVLASRRSLVTVEEVVPRLGGAHPSYTQGYDRRDNAFYQAWDAIARDRQRFTAWIDRHLRGTKDHAALRRSLGQVPT